MLRSCSGKHGGLPGAISGFKTGIHTVGIGKPDMSGFQIVEKRLGAVFWHPKISPIYVEGRVGSLVMRLAKVLVLGESG